MEQSGAATYGAVFCDLQAEGGVYPLSHLYQDDIILHQHWQPCEEPEFQNTLVSERTFILERLAFSV